MAETSDAPDGMGTSTFCFPFRLSQWGCAGTTECERSGPVQPFSVNLLPERACTISIGSDTHADGRPKWSPKGARGQSVPQEPVLFTWHYLNESENHLSVKHFNVEDQLEGCLWPVLVPLEVCCFWHALRCVFLLAVVGPPFIDATFST